MENRISRQEACKKLGINPNSSNSEIKKRCRQLLKIVHPDQNKDSRYNVYDINQILDAIKNNKLYDDSGSTTYTSSTQSTASTNRTEEVRYDYQELRRRAAAQAEANRQKAAKEREEAESRTYFHYEAKGFERQRAYDSWNPFEEDDKTAKTRKADNKFVKTIKMILKVFLWALLIFVGVECILSCVSSVKSILDMNKDFSNSTFILSFYEVAVLLVKIIVLKFINDLRKKVSDI